MKKLLLFVASLLIVGGIIGAWFFFLRPGGSGSRSGRVISFIRNPADHTEWVIPAGTRCGTAPFLFPTDGFVGFLWDDSFRPGHRHQGIDIFGGAQSGQTAVVSAYDGYLTRLPDWKSTVIIRIPDDPLHPGRQIWTYYTHLADEQGNPFISPDFPPGTIEQFVPAGTLLGFQGNYSGTPGDPTGVHLHFSIVLDDGSGKFRNELDIHNTLDPSPYFALDLNAKSNPDQIPLCRTSTAEVNP